jgi:hypothetical protein
MHDAHAVTLHRFHGAILIRLSVARDDVQRKRVGSDENEKTGKNVFHNGQPRCAVERQRTRKGKPQTSRERGHPATARAPLFLKKNEAALFSGLGRVLKLFFEFRPVRLERLEK